MQLARRAHGLTERVSASALSACFSFSRPVSYFLLSFLLSTREIARTHAGSDRGRGERGGIGENVHKQKQLEPRARDRGDADDDHDGAAWRLAGVGAVGTAR